MLFSEYELRQILACYPRTYDYVEQRIDSSYLSTLHQQGYPWQLEHVLWAVRPLFVEWNTYEQLSRLEKNRVLQLICRETEYKLRAQQTV